MSFQASLQTILNLSEQEALLIARYFVAHVYEKNTSLLEVGKQANQLLFLNEGFVRIHADFDGREITQWISSPYYFITDLSSHCLINLRNGISQPYLTFLHGR